MLLPTWKKQTICITSPLWQIVFWNGISCDPSWESSWPRAQITHFLCIFLDNGKSVITGQADVIFSIWEQLNSWVVRAMLQNVLLWRNMPSMTLALICCIQWPPIYVVLVVESFSEDHVFQDQKAIWIRHNLGRKRKQGCKPKENTYASKFLKTQLRFASERFRGALRNSPDCSSRPATAAIAWEHLEIGRALYEDNTI